MIEQIIRDFPQRPIRLLVGSEPLGVSDKVNKLCRMAREARHEILLVSDSDVRVEPDFLREVVAPFANPQVGGVTCLYRGLTDGSFGSQIEALGNSADFAPGVLVAWLTGGLDFMLGAVMVTTKKQVAGIGGFEILADHLSDDYELGNRIAANGYRVELSREPVCVVYPRQNFFDAFRHQLRWNLTVRCSRPGGHFGLVFTQGLPWAILAAAIAPNEKLAGAYLAGYAILRMAMAWRVGSFRHARRPLAAQNLDAAAARRVRVCRLAAELFPAANPLARSGILRAGQTAGASPNAPHLVCPRSWMLLRFDTAIQGTRLAISPCDQFLAWQNYKT